MYKFEDAKYRLEILEDNDAESPRAWDNIGTMNCAHRKYVLGDAPAERTDEYEGWGDWLRNEVLEPNGGHDKVVYLPLYLYDHSGITMNTEGFSSRWDSGQVGWIWATKDTFREETGYMEKELFSSKRDRDPVVKEHVKVKGRKDKAWGQVTDVQVLQGMTLITVDFDYGKVESYRKAENVVTVSPSEIEEVMSNRAEEMLKDEVRTYDMYLCGDVYGFRLSEKVQCDCCGNVEYEEQDSCWGFIGNSLADVINDMKEQTDDDIGYLFDELLKKN